jgi:tetratricopeptide (TPR) repeat protein
LQGNIKDAEKARIAVLQKGNTNSDADKHAFNEAKINQWPNIILLKSRLLNDGGYNTEALALLLNKPNNSFEKEEEQLEYVYRLGRINDDLNKEAEAIKYYKQAIVLGEFRKEYYAARAALQIGNIYENQLNKIEAIKYYNICLVMKDHEYKNSLDQRAKSGIARCKGE